jgi:hypothetical protein
MEYKCVQVGHHKKISEVAEGYLTKGWSLHTYQAAGAPNNVVHYLLLERESNPKASIY